MISRILSVLTFLIGYLARTRKMCKYCLHYDQFDAPARSGTCPFIGWTDGGNSCDRWTRDIW